MRVIWDNPPYGSAVRATAEKIGKHHYRVVMTTATRSCVTYGGTLHHAFKRGLEFQLNGFWKGK